MEGIAPGAEKPPGVCVKAASSLALLMLVVSVRCRDEKSVLRRNRRSQLLCLFPDIYRKRDAVLTEKPYAKCSGSFVFRRNSSRGRRKLARSRFL